MSRRRGSIAAAMAAAAAIAGRAVITGRRQDTDLGGQVALVTGGSRGLGFLLARELLREGCSVAICARDGEELERARALLEESSQQAGIARVLPVRGDVANRTDVARVIDETTRRFGPIDLLVNNAGIIQDGPVTTMAVEDFQQAMDVMFWGALYPTLAVLPQMRERGAGRIVNITSIGGRVSVPHLLPYSCAKCAAVGLSEGLRAELARDHISVTTVVPGLMRTGSAVQALVKGHQEAEYSWFALLDSLPGVSMDAERAAGQIVAAAKRGDAECVLSLPANAASRLHGLFPGLTADLLGLTNRFLPSPDGGSTSADRGREVQARIASPLLDALTILTRSAGRRFNQSPPRPAPSPGESPPS